jgi:uncharacterized membrane protein
MTKDRLEAFSDGVFAIVIPLLILDVRFPAEGPEGEYLLGMAPHASAFTGPSITPWWISSNRSIDSCHD